MKRLLSFLLCLMMLSAMFPVKASFEVEFSDISGHWATPAIERWSGLGIVQGANGYFRPNDSVTRGEFAAIMNRLLQFPASSAPLFEDTAGRWYEADINALAWQSVYLESQGLAKGDQPLTREETAYLVAKCLGLSGAVLAKGHLSDYDEVLVSYQASVGALYLKDIMTGMPDGSFQPKSLLTRAQAVTILNNFAEIYITQPGEYNTPIGKSILVASAGVILKNQNFDILTIAPCVDGIVTVMGGNQSSICQWVGTSELALSPARPYGYMTTQLRPTYDTRFADGLGTAQTPYIINEQAQLTLLNDYTGETSRRMYFKLGKDIQLKGDWIPIGWCGGLPETIDKVFAGRLDGDNYSITGLFMDAKIDGPGAYGLFGYLAGRVENLVLEGEIRVNAGYETTSSSNATIGNELYAGALAGMLCGATSASAENIVSHVNITVRSNDLVAAGGIAGRIHSASRGQVTGCTANGVISAESSASEPYLGSYAGGIIGIVSDGGVYSSLSTAVVTAAGGYQAAAGGIAGGVRDSSVVVGSYASGVVTARDSLMQNNAGGVIGHLQNEYSSVSTSISICQVRALGNPQYFNAVGGVAGGVYYNASIKNCYSGGTVSTDTTLGVVGGLVGRFLGRADSCYSTTKASVVGQIGYAEVGLFGSAFENSIAACAMLGGNAPFVVNAALNQTAIATPLDPEALTDIQIYTNMGWAMDKIWIMPSAHDNYRLPILKGVFEELQRSQN